MEAATLSPTYPRSETEERLAAAEAARVEAMRASNAARIEEEARWALLEVQARDVAAVALVRGEDDPLTKQHLERFTTVIAQEEYAGNVALAQEEVGTLIEENIVDALKMLEQDDVAVLDANPQTGEIERVPVSDYTRRHNISLIDTEPIDVIPAPLPQTEAPRQVVERDTILTSQEFRSRSLGAVTLGSALSVA